MKICLIGHIADGMNEHDGQTVKTRAIYTELVRKYGEKNISIVDTYDWKKRLVKIIGDCIRKVKVVDDVIVIPASRSARVFIPLLVTLKRKNHFKIHYILIGGRIYKITEKNSYLRRKIKEVDYIYAESYGVIGHLEAQGISNLYFLPNFKHLEKSRKNREVKQDKLRCCIFSRIEEKKGILDAISVIRNYNKNHNDRIALDIFGKIKDSFEKTFSTELNGSKDIKYKGVVPFDKSVEVIEKYDLLLFPTRYRTEGIPGTIIDAFFAGTPILASKWENFDEMIEEGKTGFGYEFGDVNSFLDKICFITSNRLLLSKMRKNCFIVADKYKPEKAMSVIFKNLSNCSKGRTEDG